MPFIQSLLTLLKNDNSVSVLFPYPIHKTLPVIKSITMVAYLNGL